MLDRRHEETNLVQINNNIYQNFICLKGSSSVAQEKLAGRHASNKSIRIHPNYVKEKLWQSDITPYLRLPRAFDSKMNLVFEAKNTGIKSEMGDAVTMLPPIVAMLRTEGPLNQRSWNKIASSNWTPATF